MVVAAGVGPSEETALTCGTSLTVEEEPVAALVSVGALVLTAVAVDAEGCKGGAEPADEGVLWSTG